MPYCFSSVSLVAADGGQHHHRCASAHPLRKPTDLLVQVRRTGQAGGQVCVREVKVGSTSRGVTGERERAYSRVSKVMKGQNSHNKERTGGVTGKADVPKEGSVSRE